MNKTKNVNNNLIIGVVILTIFLGLMIVSFFYTPYDVNAIKVSEKLQGPSASHWFGTDKFGRDIFSRVMVGTQTAFFVGAVVTAIGLVFGTFIGSVAGYMGGGLTR